MPTGGAKCLTAKQANRCLIFKPRQCFFADLYLAGWIVFIGRLFFHPTLGSILVGLVRRPHGGDREHLDADWPSMD